MDLKKLQNGSDIRGIALEGIPGEIPNLGLEEAQALSLGFMLWLCEKTGKKSSQLTLSVGRDSRLSGEMLKTAFIRAVEPFGVTVLDCGLASTPAMFMSTVFEKFNCDGAVMITASHLPFNRNGFKYFDKDGGLNKADIKTIITYGEASSWESNPLCERTAHSEDVNFSEGDSSAKDIALGKSPLMIRYTQHLRQLIIDGCSTAEQGCDTTKPLQGMRIVVDAGNGAGGFYATDVLEPLGADISGSCFLDPDGRFPNHVPNPEDKEAMASISRAVLSSSADFGLIFDTDVDRSAAVDGTGREIARNGIVAMAAALVSETYPGSTVVTDSITSNQLSNFLTEKLGLSHLRYKRGYKNVINKGLELNQAGTICPLAIETSGHAAFKDNYFLDDGAYLATKIVIKAANLRRNGETLDSVLSDLAEPVEAVEIRFPILAQDFGAYGDKVLEELAKFVEQKCTSDNPCSHTTCLAATDTCQTSDETSPAAADTCQTSDETCPAAADTCQTSADGKNTEAAFSGITLVQPNYEGVRIDFDETCGNGWCLLRKSLHDPIIPLNIESDEAGGVEKIKDFLRNFLADYDMLNIENL